MPRFYQASGIATDLLELTHWCVYSLQNQALAEWQIVRLGGKQTRRWLTDAIKAYIDRHPELSENNRKWLYVNASQRVILVVFGRKAKKLAEDLGVAPDRTKIVELLPGTKSHNLNIKVIPRYFYEIFPTMKFNSSLFCKAVLVANLLLGSTIAFSTHAQAQTNRASRTYSSKCSFYGQNQKQAQTIGCSIKQSSNQIIINWKDGFKTTLILSNGSWKSMPSQAKTQVRFYVGTGRVAHVEIFGGPGKGIIVVNP